MSLTYFDVILVKTVAEDEPRCIFVLTLCSRRVAGFMFYCFAMLRAPYQHSSLHTC